jgi:hypothetical protein
MDSTNGSRRILFAIMLQRLTLHQVPGAGLKLLGAAPLLHYHVLIEVSYAFPVIVC